MPVTEKRELHPLASEKLLACGPTRSRRSVAGLETQSMLLWLHQEAGNRHTSWPRPETKSLSTRELHVCIVSANHTALARRNLSANSVTPLEPED